MKRFAIPAISLAALMASGVAFAQTTPDQKPVEQQKQAPLTPDPSQTGQSSEKPKDTMAQQPVKPKDTTAQQPAQPANATATAAVTVDASKAVLATSFIGSSVYTATNENVGDINDLIFDDKGSIQAVIIGVGGFLGMGEKDVALPLNKITVTREESNAIKLTVQASREELDQAPAFDKTLFKVKTPAPDTGTGTSGTGTGGTNGTGG
jgi:sporulation protein YlmC with PRC-barrel domain